MKPKGAASFLGLTLVLALAATVLAQPAQLAWTGKEWKEFPQEVKVAYLKGVLNMAAFEAAVGGGSRATCISWAFTEELQTKTLGQVMAEVDKFYQEQPGRRNTSVIEVVMQRCTSLCPAQPPAPEKKP